MLEQLVTEALAIREERKRQEEERKRQEEAQRQKEAIANLQEQISLFLGDDILCLGKLQISPHNRCAYLFFEWRGYRWGLSYDIVGTAQTVSTFRLEIDTQSLQVIARNIPVNLYSQEETRFNLFTTLHDMEAVGDIPF